MDIYREEILEHYKNPRNFGILPNATQHRRETNASCGDLVEIYLRIVKTHGENVIEEVKFEGQGCALMIASASKLTEELKGKKISDAEKINKNKIMSIIGIEATTAREKCVMLPFIAVNKIFKSLKGK